MRKDDGREGRGRGDDRSKCDGTRDDGTGEVDNGTVDEKIQDSRDDIREETGH